MNYYSQFAVAIKEGDEKTFEIFFKMEFNNVVHFINAYLNNTQAAQDVAQDTFISFWDKRKYFGYYGYKIRK